MKQCPVCGAQYEDHVKFCRNDGRSLDDSLAEQPTILGQPSFPGRSEDDPLIGRVLASRYRLIRKLGQGGMGAVYQGEHVRINRLTAIKVLSRELASNPDFVARFEREAEMASHIDHPNAISIYDFGEAEDGIVYLAMEFVDGPPLSKVIAAEAPLPLERVVGIVRQAAEALDAAHHRGIIHRDFKPDNVMLCRKQSIDDWVEVVDFGIAKRTEVEPRHQGLTQAGFILGTPQYMSPEQVMDEPLDSRSDLYSLALVTYEMLTGALPFEGSTPQSQMIKRLVDPPKPLRLVRADGSLTPEVEQVVMRGLARAREQRYSSTVEFARALSRTAALEGGQLSSAGTAYAAPSPTNKVASPPTQPQQPPATPPGSMPAPPVQMPRQASTPAPPQYVQQYTPQPPYQAYPVKQKQSKVGLVVLIIIVAALFMMASCVSCLIILDS